MKHIRSSTLIKVVAVFGFFLSLILFTASLVGALFLLDNDAYFDSGTALENNALDAAAYHYELQLHQFADSLYRYSYYNERDFKDIFGEENCNYFFTLTDQDGNIVLTNYTPKNVRRVYSDSDFICYGEGDTPQHLILKDGIRYELTAEDRILNYLRFTRILTNRRYLVAALVPLSLITCIALLVFLCCAAGHHPHTDEIVLNLVDRIPLEIFLGVLFAFEFLLGIFLSELFNETIATLGVLAMLIPIGLWVLLTVSTRFKTQTLFTNTVIYGVIKSIDILCKQFFKIKLYWQVGIAWVMISLAELFVMIATDQSGYFLFWIIEKLVFTPLIVWGTVNLQTLRHGGKELANGNSDHEIDTAHMFPVFREHAEHLNGIGEGLKLAVEDRLKSERMRTELITNVSHDIKTPLTSIINYVDLLQREGLSSEHADDYLIVLERQSARLKKLTVDLIEASKASSGAINVEKTRLNVQLLLEQAIAEYADCLQEASLSVVKRLNDVSDIQADGRLLWRVFDNLLGNILKYAKVDTRVYITCEQVDKQVVVTFKNISAESLDISPDELTERFVRGDRSRYTEGSGLGLSIAKSLTELQGGTFDIYIDGDLFKIVLTFQREK